MNNRIRQPLESLGLPAFGIAENFRGSGSRYHSIAEKSIEYTNHHSESCEHSGLSKRRQHLRHSPSRRSIAIFRRLLVETQLKALPAIGRRAQPRRSRVAILHKSK